MKLYLLLACLLTVILCKAQYPFEQYPAVTYREFKKWKVYDRQAKESKIHFTLMIPQFFTNGDSITLQLTSFNTSDSSLMRVFRNKKQIQNRNESMWFTASNMTEPVRTADINGDGLTDLKIIIPYLGCGIASMNVRTIYLFQQRSGKFDMISFDDMIGKHRAERDFDGDANYEIITMTLTYYQQHSYWLYNLFNYRDNSLVSVNSKHDYPIMIQYLYRDNYKVTTKISRDKMKSFAIKLPDAYSKK
jgi:hypothetical protein